jgi:hypothetical protein
MPNLLKSITFNKTKPVQSPLTRLTCSIAFATDAKPFKIDHLNKTNLFNSVCDRSHVLLSVDEPLSKLTGTNGGEGAETIF